MASNNPYGRRCRLLVYPTTEAMPATPPSTALQFESDGSREQFYIAFTVEKDLVCPNLSEITIRNLAPATRRTLETANLKCELQVGWENFGMRTIFIGSLWATIHRRQGPDILTTLRCFQGAVSLNESIVAQTYAPGMAVADVVKDLAGRLAGVTFDAARHIVKGVIGPGGLSLAGRTAESLNKLAHAYGFSWSIQDGVFQALADGQAFSNTLLVSAKQGTLLSAYPIMPQPMVGRQSIEITSLLIPEILPGGQIQLESEIDPRLNGTRVLHNLVHEGSPCETTWQTRATCIEVSFGHG